MWVFKVFFLVSLVILVTAQPQQPTTSKPTIPTRPKITSPPATLPPQGFGLRLPNALSWVTSCQDVFRESEFVYQGISSYKFNLTHYTHEMTYLLYPNPEDLCEYMDMKLIEFGTYTTTGSGFPGELQNIVFNGSRTVAELYTEKALYWFNVECTTEDIRNYQLSTTAAPTNTTSNTTTAAPTTTTTPATTTAAPTSANSTTTAAATTEPTQAPTGLPVTVDITNLPCARVPGTARCKVLRQIIKGTLGGDGFFMGKRGVGWSCERVPTELASGLWRATFPDTTVVPLSVLNSSSQISPSLIVALASIALFLIQLFV